MSDTIFLSFFLMLITDSVLDYYGVYSFSNYNINQKPFNQIIQFCTVLTIIVYRLKKSKTVGKYCSDDLEGLFNFFFRFHITTFQYQESMMRLTLMKFMLL